MHLTYVIVLKHFVMFALMNKMYIVDIICVLFCYLLNFCCLYIVYFLYYPFFRSHISTNKREEEQKRNGIE